MYRHTMPKAKIAVTLDAKLLARLDALVREGAFPNRSRALEAALAERLDRQGRTRLALQCARLSAVEERALAEEGLSRDARSWPAY